MFPGVANRTKPNQKPSEPNWTQSFDWSSIGSAMEHNRTGPFFVSSIKFDYRTQSNSIDAIGSILFGEKQNGTFKIDKH